MFKSPSIVNYAGLLLSASLWGSVFATIVIALGSFDPIAVAWWRTCIAAALTLVIMVALGKPLSRKLQDWLQLGILSVFLIVLPFSFITHAGTYSNSSTIGLAIATLPMFSLMLTHYLNMISTVYWYNYVGIFIGFMGMYLLFTGDGESIDINNTTGVMLASLCPICYAIAGVLNKRVANTISLENQAAIPFITGTVLLLPVVWATDTNLLPDNPSQDAMLALLYTGAFPTAIAGMVRIYVLRRTQPAFTSLAGYIVPLISTLIGVVFMGDILKQNFWTALVLVMVGIILCQYRPKPI